MKTRTFHKFDDPGHGWLKVPVKLINDLGLIDKITGFSHYRKGYVYLEEDKDCYTFNQAMKEAGLDFKVISHWTNKQSKIRSYAQIEV